MNILEYLALTNGNIDTAIRVAPRFILGDDGEYMVTINLDEEGDIASMDGVSDALMKMTAVTPKRLERLANEFMEAAKAIVNPPSAGA